MGADFDQGAFLLQLADTGMNRDDYHIIIATLSVRNLDLERLKYGGVTVTGFQLKGLQQLDVSKNCIYLLNDPLFITKLLLGCSYTDRVA